MLPNQAPLPSAQRRLEEAKQLIAHIERRDLDQARFTRLPPEALAFSQATFFRVTRLTRFWESADGRERLAYDRLAEDLLCGLAQQRAPLLYRVWHDGRAAHIDIGSPDPDCASTIEALLYGLYPGIQLMNVAPALPSACWAYQGIVSGIPSRKTGRRQQREGETPGDIQQIERVLRGIPGAQWAIMVIARPLQREQPLASQLAGPALPAAQALTYPRDLYFTWISELSTGARRKAGSGEGIAGDPLERVDRAASYNADLLERELHRAEIARTGGMWDVQVYYGAPDAPTLGRLGALFYSAFAGNDEVVQRLRLHQAGAGSQSPAEAQTPLTSRELASYTALPSEEVLGFQVAPYSAFGLTPPAIRPEQIAVDVGAIRDLSRPVGQTYRLPLGDLTRHVLVVGTTGSGKTNTCLTLLSQLAEQRVPFLVIEPVNAGLNEYRALKHLPACATDAFRLQVFTLGDEDTAPFALNPLEIVPGDTMDAHISRLMTCLRAALPMWPPLPAIFAAALQRTYLKAGFLPRTRVAPGEPFPSMYDFADELGYVANHEVQHGGEVRQNIIGATTLRLQALMNGAAGRTLGARRSIPLDDLLARPTILELRHIGDDGDKALIMALILMRIAAAQELAGRRPEPGRPRHVILIEEAHRLLSAQPAGASDQQETTRGEVAQSFAHMLAETRKYGQSVIIAEQLPHKLVRDALGNTGLKIAHLLGSREDREALAATMRLDTPQQEALASLPPGEALVYSQGQEAPVRVSIDFVSARWPELRIDPDTIPDDREISAWMEPVNRRLLPYRLPFWGCAGCQSQCINRGAGEAMVRLSEAVQAVDQLTNSGGAGGDRALPRLVEAVDIHLSTIGIVHPARDLRYCAAIHLLYKTCGSLVDSSGVWERLSTYLTQAALIGRQERGA